MDSKLSAAIDELVEKRTFNLDALEAIKGLRDRAVALDAKIEGLNRSVEQRDAQLRVAGTEKEELRQKLDDFQARETALKAREAKVRELELREAVSTAQAQTLDKVFGTIFRNVTVREQTVKNVPHQAIQPGGYSVTTFATESATLDRTAE